MISWFVHAADAVLPGALRAVGCRSVRVSTSVGPMHVLEAEGTGDLPPLVLLHGLGSCASDWGLLLPQLLPLTRRIIAPDLPAHGRSPAPGSGFSPNLLARAACEVLAARVDEPAIVVGNSLGGAVAVRFAHTHPERVRGLLLASPGGAPMSADDLRELLAQFHLASWADSVRFMGRVLASPGWKGTLLASGVRARMGRPAVREMIGRFSVDDLLSHAEVGGLAMPVLCLWGAQDDVLPASNREFFRAHLPSHAAFEEPAGYGHAPYLDEPSDFVRRVEAFARAVVRVSARAA